MKKLIAVLILCVLAVAFYFFRAPRGPFQGSVVFQTTGPVADYPSVTYSIKGEKVRMGPNDPKKKYFLVDTLKKEMITVVPSTKTYIVTPQNNMAEMNSLMGSLTRTGITDDIAGQKCEKFLFKCKYGSSEMWGDDGLFAILEKAVNHASDYADFYNASNFGPHMALKKVDYNSEGVLDESLIATKMERKYLDDSLFQVPAGYTQYDPEKAAEDMLKKAGLK